jgi:hypothetical protein
LLDSAGKPDHPLGELDVLPAQLEDLLPPPGNGEREENYRPQISRQRWHEQLKLRAREEILPGVTPPAAS